METSILAEGEEAADLEFRPSDHELLLGLDYLFALRCLADQIPVDPTIEARLIDRMINELIYESGSSKFLVYRSTLEDILFSFKGSDVYERILEKLRHVIVDSDLKSRVAAAGLLVRFEEFDERAIDSLLEGMHAEDSSICLMSINACTSLPPQVKSDIPVLIQILRSGLDSSLRSAAAWTLGFRGHGSLARISTQVVRRNLLW
jgi:HEAT repeat protein